MGKTKQIPRTIDLDTILQDKQKLAFKYLTNDENVNMVAFGGSAGSSKTFLGCAWVISSCLMYPETRWLVGRNKLINLKQSTLVTFFDICKMWGFKTNIDFLYNAHNNTVTFKNGSQVILKDLAYYPSDPEFDSLGGLEITGAFVDEAQEVDFKAVNIILSRIRYKLNEYNLSPKLLMTCNPGKNFLYTEFYLKWKDGTLESNKVFIQALPHDNKYLNPGYIKSLNNLDYHSKQRLLYGNWEFESSYGLCNFDILSGIFVPEFRRDEIQDLNFYLSVDPSRIGKDTTVLMVMQGNNIIRIEQLAKTRGNEVYNLVDKYITLYNIPSANVIIDGGGLGGPIIDFLREKFKNINEFISNGKTIDNGNYQNLKTQCSYKLSEMINGGDLKIYTDDIIIKKNLLQELDASLTADKVDVNTKLAVVSKDHVKKVIGRSPDLFDCLMMLCYFKLRGNKYSGNYAVKSLRVRK